MARRVGIPGRADGRVLITGSGHVIQDEGTPLTNRANLNFVGAGVTATDNPGNSSTDVTIPGGGGGSPATSAAALIFAYGSFR